MFPPNITNLLIPSIKPIYDYVSPIIYDEGIGFAISCVRLIRGRNVQKYENAPEVPITQGTCKIRIRCMEIPFPPKVHCGLDLLIDGKNFLVDGTGAGLNNIGWRRGETKHYPDVSPFTVDLGPEKCECLRKAVRDFNTKNIDRDPKGKNSNWSINYVLKACKLNDIVKSFNGFKKVPTPPIGWNHEGCPPLENKVLKLSGF